jgi:glycosyltransferase involved in cell wall biosynthesis
MNSDIIFSVIIPHKNTPDLLTRCLNSIPRRDDIQIIVVDDNSDEEKVDFDDFPGLTDERVEVYFTKEGKGAGYARNIGLEHARGKWLLFADADDFFTNNAFAVLFNLIDLSVDIIYFKVTSCFSDTLEEALRYKETNELIDNCSQKNTKAEYFLRYKQVAPWGKMIRNGFIKNNHIKFDEVRISEDVMFSVTSGYFANEIKVIDDKLYCVTVSRGSLTNTLSKDNLLIKYIVALKYNKFLRSNGCKEYQTFIVSYYLLISLKYGIKYFIRFLKLACQYRMNFLFGLNIWLRKFVSYRKFIKSTRRYLIKYGE